MDNPPQNNQPSPPKPPPPPRSPTFLGDRAGGAPPADENNAPPPDKPAPPADNKNASPANNNNNAPPSADDKPKFIRRPLPPIDFSSPLTNTAAAAPVAAAPAPTGNSSNYSFSSPGSNSLFGPGGINGSIINPRPRTPTSLFGFDPSANHGFGTSAASSRDPMSSFAPDPNKYQSQSFSKYAAAFSIATTTAPLATGQRNQPSSLGSNVARASAPPAVERNTNTNPNSAGLLGHDFPTAPSGFARSGDKVTPADAAKWDHLAAAKESTTTRRTNGNGGTQAVSMERYEHVKQKFKDHGTYSATYSRERDAAHYTHRDYKRLVFNAATDTMWYLTEPDMNHEKLWKEWVPTDFYVNRTETTFDLLLRDELDLHPSEYALVPTGNVIHLSKILNRRFHMACGTFLQQWFNQNAALLCRKYKEEKKQQHQRELAELQQLAAPACKIDHIGTITHFYASPPPKDPPPH